MKKAKGNFDLLLKMKNKGKKVEVKATEKVDEYKDADLESKTNKELRSMLKDKGLAVYGTKDELIERLKAGE